MSKRRTGTPQVHTVTSAPMPLGDDIAKRARRYMFQMGLRTACFLSAVITWGRVPTPISVALLIGAVVLPYIAVVLANAGRERPDRADPFDVTRQIAAAPFPARDAAPTGGRAAWDDDLSRWDQGMPRWDDASSRWVPNAGFPQRDVRPGTHDDEDPAGRDRMRPDGPHRG